MPNGRAAPACLDLKTGKLLYYNMGFKGGGNRLSIIRDWIFNGHTTMNIGNGHAVAPTPSLPVVVGDQAFVISNGGMAWTSLADISLSSGIHARDPLGPWRPAMTSSGLSHPRALIAAGRSLYVGGQEWVASCDLATSLDSVDPVWKASVTGNVTALVAGAYQLFAVTDSELYCFGAEAATAHRLADNNGHPEPAASNGVSVRSRDRATVVLGNGSATGGLAIVVSAASADLACELARRGQMQVVILEPRAAVADELRARLQREGVYGSSIAVLCAAPGEAPLPPYSAEALVIEDGSLCRADEAFFDWVYRALHPYRGQAYLALAEDGCARLRGLAAGRWAGHASVSDTQGLVRLARVGGLSGAGNSTHEHTDAANTRCSGDTLIKAPLGVLWFDAPGDPDQLPRHGHGPRPQVIDGRLIIEGSDSIRAVNIYSGRVLWDEPITGVGWYFNTTVHQAGANGTGGNFVSTADSIYVACTKECLRLDIATGRELARFPLPPELAGKPDDLWGYINVSGNYLVGGIGSRKRTGVAAARTQLIPDPEEEPETIVGVRPAEWNPRTVGSRTLFVMDRRSGRLLWSVKAEREFRHNGICIGNGWLFAVDPLCRPAPPGPGGKSAPRPLSVLLSLDLATGRQIWARCNDAPGTLLSYSCTRDVLVESGLRTRDTLGDEAKGMRAYWGSDGTSLWEDAAAVGPSIIRDDTVLKDGGALDLLTGRPTRVIDPITREHRDFAWGRGHGCNTPSASTHLLTFRSNTAGFADLLRLGGTGNLGGFRSGCTNNLIAAGGVLCAPDYTRTCTCSYPMQASLGLVPDDQVELWTSFPTITEPIDCVRHIGVNFGAPGSHLDDCGTLWIEHPRIDKGAGLRVNMSSGEFYRRHSLTVDGPMPWLTASGVRNLRSVSVGVNLEGAEAKPYTVRLYFAEPAPAAKGDHIVDVLIQGRKVEERLDIVAAAGGAEKLLIREYRDIEAASELKVEVRPIKPSTAPALCGMEVFTEMGR